VLRQLGLEIPVAGLVKDERHRTRGIIYNNREVNLNGYRNVLHLITRIQDEVHRFAIAYHRSLRKRTQIRSILDDIPGIGERRRKNLLLKLGSVDAIRKASVEELLTVPSMNKRVAQGVVDFFNPEQNQLKSASQTENQKGQPKED
ncbi:MAG: hypothetical protein GX833_06305, partial [Clostridium sp.]|nr:hypothetical protein [Clostridium sp.]